jgi:hypothetical protein
MNLLSPRCSIDMSSAVGAGKARFCAEMYSETDFHFPVLVLTSAAQQLSLQ